MNITVIGCGRWGSLITWYLDKIGHRVTLYGRAGSAHMERFLKERRNDLLEFRPEIGLSTDLECTRDAEVIVISVPSQNLRSVMRSLQEKGIREKIYVLCMKGIEIETGKRLSEVASEFTDPDSRVAVWIGPGHVQEFYSGIPNCMVIDSADERVKVQLIREFTGPLIRFYYGEDLIGNEIGAAAKNVIGIAAGMLDGMGLTTLKGALMSRGTREVSRLIDTMGGNPFSAYGLCHLGDYEATVFSKFSHNRSFGEAFAKGEHFEKLAEGYYTADAIHRLSLRYNVDLPICDAVYRMLYNNISPKDMLDELFSRNLKRELV